MGIKVLSLFDGMSCGQLALQRLGIEVDTYYASEIDKYAIQVTQANFPNTIQIGDVCNVDPKDFEDIDLITCGSPCQGFSFAGKQLAFDDPRSALFFEFIRILKEIKPKYFLLENVRMKQEFQDVITDQVSLCYPEFQGGDLFGGKIKPSLINSALVSAQNRLRLYWTNIPNIEQPIDKNIILEDILIKQDTESYALSDLANKRAKDNPRSRAFKPGQEKSGALLANQYKQSTDSLYALKEPKQVGVAVDINGHDILKRVYSPEGKSPTLNTMGGGNREPKVLSGAWRARSYDDKGQRVKWKESKPKQMLELRKDQKSNSIGSVQKDSVVVQDLSWRRLLPLECERLQTVPDNYTNHVSNSQRFKMLGNGWTIDVIAHILKNMDLK
jgi:DNA (cytosine-5)-methyltransferase 3A|tara:strand:+ start:10341 stop:11498 length:1158 start_codon:yes stop_codon:yes gene_type:complete